MEKNHDKLAKVGNFQQVRPDMQNWKKSIFLVVSMLVALIVLRKAYVMLFNGHSSLPTPLSVKRIIQQRQEQAAMQQHDLLRDYNFKRMLKLIEQTKFIKKCFYHQFKEDPDVDNGIDKQQTQLLLAELYREKLRLERYVWKIRVYYKDLVPRKKYRSLLYHQKVIDGCIKDLESILRHS